MTPREADLALLLESVDCVVAAYTTGPHSGGTSDFIVELRPYTGGTIARVHYAMRRLLTHEECGRVLLRDADLRPRPAFMLRVRSLALDDAERRSALRRAAERTTGPVDPEEEEAGVEPSDLTLLTVGTSFTLPGHLRVVTNRVRNTLSNDDAFEHIEADDVDLVIWDAGFALRAASRLRSLLAVHPEKGEMIVILAPALQLEDPRERLDAERLNSVRLAREPITAIDAANFLRWEIRARSQEWRLRCRRRG